ncbi:MAG TPA: peptidoglycan DD-metalloendopeptidase family protein [Acidimicrobiales bacterium]|nr:peptidoglycan DD-metalloendopeptidase family protein [Acidimicrobiales bacterium]
MSMRAARPTRRVAAVAVALATAFIVVVPADPAGAAPPDPVVHAPPVDAPVADPFRPPATTYGPGNRGLAYDLAPGTPVRATADGTVAFAGPVGSTLHVTVLHADGLRTSYSFLSEVDVQRGDRVDRGAVVGRAGPGFHLGARDGEHYLDPASLFGEPVIEVRLVPHGQPLPPTDAGLLAEQSWLRDLVRAEKPGFLRRMASAVVRHGAPIVERFAGTVDAAWHTWTQLNPVQVTAGVVTSLARHLRQECTAASVVPAPPAGERVALLVAGLGSSSDHGAIDDVDLDALGYAGSDVLRYRYGGGRTPGSGDLHPDLAGIPAAAYVPEDTLGDVTERGRELADLIEHAAAARPGVPIDVYAHSLGGLVTRVALLELAERRDRGQSTAIDALGPVATIGSPHRGADLATVAVLSEKGFVQDVAHIRSIFDIPIDPYSPAVRQLAETSALVQRLGIQGVPDGVELRTIAARGDLVVAADKADVDGRPAAIVDLSGPHAHAALPGDPDTTRELQLGLAGLPPACQGFGDAVLDAVVPEIVAGVTDVAGLLTLLPS